MSKALKELGLGSQFCMEMSKILLISENNFFVDFAQEHYLSQFSGAVPYTLYQTIDFLLVPYEYFTGACIYLTTKKY